MLAGPGVPNLWYTLPVFLAIAVTALSSHWILAGADRVRRHLGESGIRILTRLMGLMPTAIAVQFVLNGLADVGMVKPVR
jgi:multiple antibiotic resistance protein